MTISENHSEDTIELIISGRLDTTTAPMLEDTLPEKIKGYKTLVLDLSDVEYVSSAGLRVILIAHKLMATTKNKMTIRNPSPFCKQVLEATGMDSVLSITQDAT